MPVGDGLAHQELLRALSGLVVVVDDAVVGGLEAIVFLDLAAGGQRGEHHVGSRRPGRRARRRNRPAAPCAGNPRRRSRCGSALRSPASGCCCAARSRRCSGRAACPCRHPRRRRWLRRPACSCWRRRPRRICPCRRARPPPRSRCRPSRSRGSAAAASRRRVAATRMRSFWPSFRPSLRPRGPERRRDRRDLVGRGADLLEDRGDVVALLDGDRALVPAVAAGGLGAGLGQQRDVLGHDAGLEAGVGIRRAVGRIGQRRAAALSAGSRPDSGSASRRSSWRCRARAR